jgi:hypothetical protein
MTNEELDSVMAKAKEQFRKGEPLFGKNGAFNFMLEIFLNSEKKRENILAEGLSDSLAQCHKRSVPADGCTTLHRPPDTQLTQVHRQQKPKGVPCRPEVCLPGGNTRKGENRALES